MGDGWFDSFNTHHARVCKLAKQPDLESGVCGFDSLLGYQASLSQSVEEAVSKTVQSWFESKGRHHARVRKLAKRVGLKPTVCRFDSCRGYHIFIPGWLEWIRHRSSKPTYVGSIPTPGAIEGKAEKSLSWPAKLRVHAKTVHGVRVLCLLP